MINPSKETSVEKGTGYSPETQCADESGDEKAFDGDCPPDNERGQYRAHGNSFRACVF
jgi:hypothetical protein